MFAKSTLASAVAAALGVSAINIAQADSVFFPNLIFSNSVSTIVSVINTGQGLELNGPKLHYRYWRKTAISDLKATCDEVNVHRPTSVNDIQTIDLSGNFAGDTKGVLFNDPSNNNAWSNFDFAFAKTKPNRGFLVVDDNDEGDDEDEVEAAYPGNLTGEAIVIEFGSGATWGYQAISDESGDINYEEWASANPSRIAFMPFDEITTALFVTPLAADRDPLINEDEQLSGKLTATVQLGVRSGGDYFVYDRDENPVSGAKPLPVTCVGRVDLAAFLDPDIIDLVKDGGWAEVQTSSATSNGAPAAVVIKLEYNEDGTLNGDDVGGTFNNAFLLGPAPQRN